MTQLELRRQARELVVTRDKTAGELDKARAEIVRLKQRLARRTSGKIR